MIVALALALALSDPPSGLAPGVTVLGYDLGAATGDLSELPELVDGQTPNEYLESESIELEGGIGALKQRFFGRVKGWLAIETAGEIEFELEADDAAQMWIDGQPLAVAARAAATAKRALAAGLHPLRIDCCQDQGDFALRLRWRTNPSLAFLPVPRTALFTEVGQTHVVSPGVKTFRRAGESKGSPGDLRPLEGVHPGYVLENFRPAAFTPGVGGMDFLPDGRLAVSTWDPIGAVYLLDHLDDPAHVTVKKFADGLGEPLGLQVVDGVIHVSQKGEVTKLVDVDGDDVADEYLAVAQGWPASFNYHEFTFNLQAKDGRLYVTTSVPLKTGNSMLYEGSEPGFPVPFGPGSLLEIDPAARTWKIVADGFRTPNGMGIGPGGDLFVCDNQGSWLPASRLDCIEPGGFYGHPASAELDRPYPPPAVWFPQDEIGNSPSQPILLQSGPHAGQLLVGDVTYGGLQRVFLEKVRGRWQGCVLRHSQGLEGGINRLLLAKDGVIYAGGVGSNGNWNHAGTKFGLQRLRPTNKTAFEIERVRARADGLVVELSRSVPLDVLQDRGNYDVEQWRYAPTVDYGGPKVDREQVEVAAVRVAREGRNQVFLALPGLKDGRVVHLRLVGFSDDTGARPWSTEAWYTLNARPDDAGPGFADVAATTHVVREPAQRKPEETLAPLFASDSLEGWRTIGEATFSLEGGVLTGSGAVSRNSFLMSPKPMKDFVLDCEVWLEPGRNSGIQLRSHVNAEGFVYGYQIELDGSARAWSGGLYDEARRGWLQSLANDEPARRAFRPGEWNRVHVECIGPRIRSAINGVPCVDFEDDADADGHLMFQVHGGAAMTVKFRDVRIAKVGD